MYGTTQEGSLSEECLIFCCSKDGPLPGRVRVREWVCLHVHDESKAEGEVCDIEQFIKVSLLHTNKTSHDTSFQHICLVSPRTTVHKHQIIYIPAQAD